MRKRLLLITLMLSVLFAVSFKTVSASTDCDLWLQQYKEQLANYPSIKHIRHRIHHYLHPKPHVVRTSIPVPHIVRPRLSPQEMLRRFHILCGDLPPEESPLTPGLPIAPPFPPPAFPELSSAEVPPVSVVPPVAAVTPTGGNSPTTPPTQVISPPIGPVIPPVAVVPPATVTAPVVPPVPEPASFILLLTGFAGVLAFNSRR